MMDSFGQQRFCAEAFAAPKMFKGTANSCSTD
jgi:hypothetical protein